MVINMKVSKRIVLALVLQLVSFGMLFLPIFVRKDLNVAVTELLSLVLQYSEVANQSEYSYMGVLGLSTLLSAVIIVTALACWISIVIKIVQLIKNNEKIGNRVGKVAVYTLLTSFAVFGVLTTSTIKSTLSRWNIEYYINALIGKENGKALWEYVGTSISPYIEGMYGMEYYDYWGYLKITPAYFAVLMVMIISTIVYIKGSADEAWLA